MVSKVQTVAFLGIEAVPVEVQVQVAPGMPRFLMVGLPDKAVKEASERVRGNNKKWREIAIPADLL